METILLCLKVFFARLLDVSIGSVRMIFLVKQKNLIAGILAFVEIVIWFLVAKEVLTRTETNLLVIACYAGGYACGTYIGGLINRYLVKGTLTAMVIIKNESSHLIETLRDAHYGVSVMKLEEEKMLLIIEFKKKNLKKLKALIKQNDNNAFLIINESLHTENGYIH